MIRLYLEETPAVEIIGVLETAKACVIKAAIKECDGLDGARLEACYAEFGCDVDRVTEHYARAAGIEKKQRKA